MEPRLINQVVVLNPSLAPVQTFRLIGVTPLFCRGSDLYFSGDVRSDDGSEGNRVTFLPGGAYAKSAKSILRRYRHRLIDLRWIFGKAFLPFNKLARLVFEYSTYFLNGLLKFLNPEAMLVLWSEPISGRPHTSGRLIMTLHAQRQIP